MIRALDCDAQGCFPTNAMLAGFAVQSMTPTMASQSFPLNLLTMFWFTGAAGVVAHGLCEEVRADWETARAFMAGVGGGVVSTALNTAFYPAFPVSSLLTNVMR